MKSLKSCPRKSSLWIHFRSEVLKLLVLSTRISTLLKFFSQRWEQILIWFLFSCHSHVCVYRLKWEPRFLTQKNISKILISEKYSSLSQSGNNYLLKTHFIWVEYCHSDTWVAFQSIDANATVTTKKDSDRLLLSSLRKKNPKFSKTRTWSHLKSWDLLQKSLLDLSGVCHPNKRVPAYGKMNAPKS